LPIRTLPELDGEMKRKVVDIINNTCPDANVVGVLLTPQPWDIRPFVKIANEKEIYIVRVLDTSILRADSLKEEALDAFEQLSKVNHKINTIREWGTYSNRIWYRRILVEKTFEDVLLDGSSIAFSEYLALTAQIAEEVMRWHSLGFVHGHINYRNIGLSSNKRVHLLDHKAGEFACRASNILKCNLSNSYDEYIVAPEVLSGESATTASDCYGFATFCRMLSTRINHTMYAEKSGAALRLINVLLAQMKNPKPDSRPTMKEYLTLIGNVNEMMREAEVVGENVSVSKAFLDARKIVSRHAKDGDGDKNKAEASRGERAEAAALLSAGRGDAHEAKKQKLSTIIDLGAKFRRRNMRDDTDATKLKANATIDFVPAASVVKAAGKPAVEASRAPAKSATPTPTLQFEQDMNFVMGKHKPILKNPKLSLKGVVATFVASLCLACIVLSAASAIRYFSESHSSGYNWESFDGSKYSFKDLQLYWDSGDVGKMMKVIQAIVSPYGMNPDAEQIVSASILRGEERLPTLDSALVRAVYDPLWGADKIAESEKRTIYVLASAKMFDRDVSKELIATIDDKDISSIILFAMIATSGGERDHLLKQNPLSKLFSLPEPAGTAFEVLDGFIPNLHLADGVVKGTVKVLATLGNDATMLEEYLKGATQAKLAVLATATSNNPVLAEKLLTAIVKNPVRSIKNEFAEWGRRVDLIGMTELSVVQQFFLLSGTLGENRTLLKPETAVKLLTHPSPKARQEAIVLALQTIKFNHPAAQEALATAYEQPNLLTGMQLLLLAQFMENPNPKAADQDTMAGGRVIQRWIHGGVDKKLLTKIVLASSGAPESSKLDYEVIRYLNSEGWQLTVNNIKKMVKHPDYFTRMFAYTETIHLDNKKEAVSILEAAQKTENNADALKTIQHNLKVLQEEVKSAKKR